MLYRHLAQLKKLEQIFERARPLLRILYPRQGMSLTIHTCLFSCVLE